MFCLWGWTREISNPKTLYKRFELFCTAKLLSFSFILRKTMSTATWKDRFYMEFENSKLWNREGKKTWPITGSAVAYQQMAAKTNGLRSWRQTKKKRANRGRSGDNAEVNKSSSVKARILHFESFSFCSFLILAVRLSARTRVWAVQVCRPAEISCCGRWRRRSSGSGLWPWPGRSGGSPTGWCPPPECGCWATAALFPRPSSARGQVRKTIVAVIREDATHTHTHILCLLVSLCCCHCYCQQMPSVK